MKSLFLLLFLIPYAAFADNVCDGHQIRLDSPGMPLEGLPVLNQEEWGHCYAFASAIAYDALRFNLYSDAEKAAEKGSFIDPVALASFKASADDKMKMTSGDYQTEGGGDISDKYDRPAYASLCELRRPKDVNRPLDQFTSTSNNEATNRKYFQFLAKESEKIFEEKKHYDNLSDFYKSEFKKIEAEMRAEAVTDEITLKRHRRFDEFVENFYHYSLDTPDGVKAIHESLYANCVKSTPIQVKGKIQLKIWSHAKDTLDDFDHLFTDAFCGVDNGINKPMPVLLDVYGDALSIQKFFNQLIYNEKDISDHMVAAIGMRKNEKGEIEVLVRNSAGNCSAKDYITEIECDRSKRAFWITEKNLLKITQEARTIQLK